MRLAAQHSLAAGIYFPRGQFSLALSADREACQIGKDYGLAAWIPITLVTITAACLTLGQYAEAEQALQELEELAIPSSNEHGYAHALRGGSTAYGR